MNDTLKISHLVVNGCSYTYGHGIKDPINDAWPSLLAKELGVPLINLAIPGQGNIAIQKSTYRYLYKNLYYDNNPLYIHAYSQSAREEIYLSKNALGPVQECVLVDSSDTSGSQLEKEFIIQKDEHAYYLLEEGKFQIWASINALLDCYNINHLSTDYMPQTDGFIKDWITKHYQILKSEVETHPSRLKNFNLVTSPISKTSCLHETEEGHKYLADYILKQIHLRWNKIEVIKKDYAKMNDTLVLSPHAIQKGKYLNDLPDHLEWIPDRWARNVYYLNELGIDYTKKNWMGKPQESILP